MAEEFNLGKALTIPEDTFKNLGEIDDKINAIADSSERMAKNFGGAMSLMSKKTSDFLNKIGNAEIILEEISKTGASSANNTASALSKTATEAEKAANSIADVGESLASFDRQGRNIADLKDKLEEINKLLTRDGGIRDPKKQQDLVNQKKALEEELERQLKSSDQLIEQRLKERETVEKNVEAEEKATARKIESLRKEGEAYEKLLLLRSKSNEKETSDWLADKKKEQLDAEKSAIEARDKAAKEEQERVEKISEAENKRRKSKSKFYEESISYANRLDKTEEANAKKREQEQKRIEANSRKAKKLADQEFMAYISTTKGALEAAKAATTYNERLIAIKGIERAIKNLSITDKDYERNLNRLSDAHKRLSIEQRKVESSYKDIKVQQNKMLDTSGQLARKLALVFSVSQIQGYLMNIVRVTGEFEKQNVALASILQNKDQADKLFGQITELAVKSPFQLKELITYTKSLSAYQVEYEKLYDTTKMLADVSAGLGVDMQRLILAFGQVKAANFLRGTEVRQFTEAGLNILGELAKYYSELEGRMVSVGEVQERVTKRMVAFGDVEEIFKRITSAGGMFYQMQEKQAETLAGQISNLSDSIDIMMNSIGQSNYGILTTMVSLIRSIVDNWRIFANVLQSSTLALGAYAYVTLSTARAKGAFTAANIAATASEKGFLAAIAKSTIALRKFGVFLKSNPYVLVITALGAATLALLDHKQAVDKNREAYDRLSRMIDDNKKNAKELLSALSDSNEEMSNAIANLEKYERGTDEYSEAEDKANKERAKQNKLLSQLKTEYPEIYSGIVKQEEGTLDLAAAQEKLNKELERSSYLSFLAKRGEGLFSDGLLKNIEDATESQKNYNTATENLENSYKYAIGRAKELLATIRGISDADKKAVMEVINGNYSLEESVKRLIEATRNASSLGNVAGLLSEPYREYTNIKDDVEEDKLRIEKNIDDISNRFKSYYGVRTENEKKAAADAITSFLEAINVKDDAIRKFVSQTFFLKVGVQFVQDEGKTKATLGEIEEQLNKYIKDNKLSFIDEIKPNKGLPEYFKELQEQLDSVEKDIGRFSTATQQLEYGIDNKERLEQLKEERRQIIQLQKAYGEYNDKQKKTGRGTADNSELNRLKEKIRLLKEASKAYDEYIKYFSKDVALEKVRKDFKGSPVESIVAEMSFDTQGLIDGIRSITNTAGEEGAKAIEDAIRPLEKKKVIDVEVRNIDDIRNQIESIFSDYEFNVSLQEAGIDTSAMKDMLREVGASDYDIDLLGFNYDSFELTIEKLRAEMNNLYLQGGEENLKLAKETQKKITQMELEEARKRMDELLELREQYLTKEEKIEQLERDIEGWQHDLILETNEQTRELLELRIRAAEDAIAKLKSEALELTAFWRTLFGDLEDLSWNSLKEIDRQRREVMDNAREYFRNGKVEGYDSSYVDSKGVTHSVHLSIEQFNRLIKSKKRLDKEFDKSPIQKFFDTLSHGKEKGEETIDFVKRLTEDFEAAGNQAFDSAEDIMKMFNASDEAMEKLGEAKQIFSGAMDIGKGVGRIAGGDVIGGSLAALKGLSSIVQTIGAIGDRKKEKQIQKELELIEKLEKSYEKLKEAIDDAFSLDSLESFNDQAEAAIVQQNDALNRAIKKEEDKKKTDKKRIKEWEEQIEENNKKLKELQEERIASLGGIGSQSAMKTAAQSFADAWYEAFKETGDGLKGLEDNFANMFDNIIKKQIMLRASDAFLKGFFEQIDSIFAEDSEGGGIATRDELDKIKERADELFPQLNEYLKGLMDSLGVVGGETKDTMSALQKGIEGISEPTAQVLAAITESIRYFSSDSNLQLHTIVNEILTPNPKNPYLNELRLQTEILRSMNSLWSSLTTTKAGTSGKILKIMMM